MRERMIGAARPSEIRIWAIATDVPVAKAKTIANVIANQSGMRGLAIEQQIYMTPGSVIGSTFYRHMKCQV